jgi:hypothetical protein
LQDPFLTEKVFQRENPNAKDLYILLSSLGEM